LKTLFAPTPTRLNLTLVVEQAIRLSAAKATRAKLRVDIDMLRFLALGSIAGRLVAAELRGLAAERGGPPPPGFEAERVAFDAC
jgi:hypothetical protein